MLCVHSCVLYSSTPVHHTCSCLHMCMWLCIILCWSVKWKVPWLCTEIYFYSSRKGHSIGFSSFISCPTYIQYHISTTPLHGVTCITRAGQCGVSCQPLLYCGQWGFLPVAVDPSTWDHSLPDVGCWWDKDQHCAAIPDLHSQCRELHMSSHIQWAICQHFYCCSTQS